MKNILVLIDNSFNPNYLAVAAMNIALTIGANITLAHSSKRNSAADDYQDNYLTNLNEKEGMLLIAEHIKKLASQIYSNS